MIPRHLLIGVAVMALVAAAMGIYVLRMRRSMQQSASAAEDTRPLAPPVSGPTEKVTLWIADDDAGVLRPQGADIPLPSGRQERAQELLQALLGIYLGKASPHALPSGADVRDVYLVDPGLAVIDTNATFADAHRSGVLVEELTVASMIQTLASNVPGINRVKILVDGKSRETLAGHADLSNIYDVAAVARTVEALQQVQ